MKLNEKQEQLCNTSQWDFSHLTALFLNCTLKKSPEKSHTQGLIDISKAIMEKNGVTVEVLRPIDYFGELAIGVYTDMRARSRFFDLREPISKSQKFLTSESLIRL